MKLMLANPGAKFGHHEPQVSLGVPACPDHLCDEARGEWNRLAPELVSLGVLCQLDSGVLAAYCQAFARWAEAERNLAKNGPIAKTHNGFQVPSPWLAIANKAMGLMKQFGGELGLSPISRSSIKLAAKQSTDREFSEYMIGGPHAAG